MKKHISVLLEESIESLKIKKNGIYIDSTFGCGGHSKLILSKLGKNGKLISLDKDPETINIAKKINDPRFKFLNLNFSNLNKINLNNKINGILFDLGLSSIQINNPKRGFSFIKNGPLDMRINQKKGISAIKWIKEAKFNEINFILKNFGEENYHKRIAKAICKYKKIKPITKTKELSNIIKLNCNNIIKKNNKEARSFQAIRMYINNEIKEIKLALKYSLKLLSKKGRISIISFHSVEDKIIKKFIKINSINFKKIKFINKIKPSLFEIKNNSKAKNATLRVIEKL